jgi:hypothetical protein
MYMWGTVIAFAFTLVVLGFVTWNYFDKKGEFRSGYADAKEVAVAAQDVKRTMLAVLLSWTWPVAVPALVVYGLYRLYKSVDADSKNPTK